MLRRYPIRRTNASHRKRRRPQHHKRLKEIRDGGRLIGSTLWSLLVCRPVFQLVVVSHLMPFLRLYYHNTRTRPLSPVPRLNSPTARSPYPSPSESRMAPLKNAHPSQSAGIWKLASAALTISRDPGVIAF